MRRSTVGNSTAPARGQPYYSTETTSESLASVLRGPAWHIPGDTPIARLDAIPFHEGSDFMLLGPMPAAQLPAGTVRPASSPRYVYSGERWDTLGMLTAVSIDVLTTGGGVLFRACAIPHRR